ncbi:MAG: hypothetical protein P8Y24_11225 [Gammaproteobacteria bacterium]
MKAVRDDSLTSGIEPRISVNRPETASHDFSSLNEGTTISHGHA